MEIFFDDFVIIIGSGRFFGYKQIMNESQLYSLVESGTICAWHIFEKFVY